MNKRKYLLHTALLAVVLAAGFYAKRTLDTGNYDRIYPMTELTQNMRTHCVGRLLIDLPEGTSWSADASGARLSGYLTLSVTTDVSQEQYEALIAQRWQELEKLEKRSARYIDSPATKASPLENSAVFAYGFRENEGPDLDGVVRKNIFHDAEGYLWRDGTLFKLGPTLNASEEITNWLPRLHARKNDEIPEKPGLCLNGAFVDAYYDLDGFPEAASWRFKLPNHFGLVVRHSKVWQPEQPMLERYRESKSEFASIVADVLTEPGVVAGRKEYRAKQRVVAGMEGDEYVVGATGGDSNTNEYETNAGGEWNFPGAVTPNAMPSININLETTFETVGKPAELGSFATPEEAPGYPSEAEFFEVWDGILNSIRWRPGSLVPPPPGSTPPIGYKNARPMPATGTDYSLEEFLASLKPKEDWMEDL